MITTEQDESRMKELIHILNSAAKTYYSDQGESPLSDAQYDRYLSELIMLEYRTGIQLPNSPTDRVGFEVEGNKYPHYKPILSLKDTKSIEELQHFLGEHDGILSWKLDGISIVIEYDSGVLVRALSRGDGMIGKDITNNVMLIQNVPTTIPIKNHVIVRGEGCIAGKDFEQIKRTKEGERFSNPRNLASGLVNASRTSSVLLKHVRYFVHSLVHIDEMDPITTRSEEMEYMRHLGFTPVEYSRVYNYDLIRHIDDYTSRVGTFEYPVDGLVLTINDVGYGESLGTTARYPKHSMAFKWPDEIALSKVTGMKWSVSKTGLITPVVMFDPVELEGTKVKQASLHSLKIFKDMGIGKGDTLRIYKANKIIPTVDENMTRSGTEEYPKKCPVCGSDTRVVVTEKTEKLYCKDCGKKEI